MLPLGVDDEEIPHLGNRTHMTQAGSDLKASSLLSEISDSRKYLHNLPAKEVIKQILACCNIYEL